MSSVPSLPFKVVQSLQQDSRGEVLLVERTEDASSEYFLLTRLPAELATRHDAQEAFTQTLDLATKLRHPNLARVLEPSDGMSFLHELGGNLQLDELMTALHEGGLTMPPDVAVSIALEVAHGLAYLHGYQDESGRPLRLVHGDVTTDRIRLGLQGEVKLSEFVTATTHRAGGHQPPWVMPSIDFHYSPEQLAGEPLDPRSDVFALGLLTWKLLASRVPRGRAIPRLDHVIDRFPKAIADLVAQALSPERDLRFASAVGYAEALRQAASSWAKPAEPAVRAQWFSRYAMLRAASDSHFPEKTEISAAPAQTHTSLHAQRKKPAKMEESGTLETTLAVRLRQQPKSTWIIGILAALITIASTLLVLSFLRTGDQAVSQPSLSALADVVIPASQPASLPASLPTPPPTPVVVHTPITAPGTLSFHANAKVNVFVDGKKIASGVTKLERLLPAGHHTLRVVPISKKLLQVERAIDITSGKPQRIDIVVSPKGKKRKR